jgi:hypothetical protein
LGVRDGVGERQAEGLDFILFKYQRTALPPALNLPFLGDKWRGAFWPPSSGRRRIAKGGSWMMSID